MTQYWITTSNWYDQQQPNRPCSSAINREKRQIWWYDIKRNQNQIISGDKVLIYQSENNAEAKKENIIIDNDVKGSFIGNFTLDKLIFKKDSTINECWTDEADGWLKTVETKFLWPRTKVIKRKNINDELLLEITRRKNIGLVFKGRTWIPIRKDYYDLVISKVFPNEIILTTKENSEEKTTSGEILRNLFNQARIELGSNINLILDDVISKMQKIAEAKGQRLSNNWKNVAKEKIKNEWATERKG